MLDVLVEFADSSEFDEHVLVFIGDGGQESEGAWRRLCDKVRRLPSGQDFVLTRADNVCPCLRYPALDHLYDGMPQARYEGSDDLLDFAGEFFASARRIGYVVRTKSGK